MKLGDKKAALATWKALPMGLQKLATLPALAEILHKQGATNEARALAKLCASLDNNNGNPLDFVVCKTFEANIYRTVGDKPMADKTLREAATNPRVSTLESRRQVAVELADAGLWKDAYEAIHRIESIADRAVPLAKLADKMITASIKSKNVKKNK